MSDKLFILEDKNGVKYTEDGEVLYFESVENAVLFLECAEEECLIEQGKYVIKMAKEE